MLVVSKDSNAKRMLTNSKRPTDFTRVIQYPSDRQCRVREVLARSVVVLSTMMLPVVPNRSHFFRMMAPHRIQPDPSLEIRQLAVACGECKYVAARCVER